MTYLLKVFKFIKPDQKYNIGIAFVFSVLVAFLEMIGIVLARAFYRVPDIIILDEPTSSLNKITEKNILEILQSISKEFCVVIITHSLDNIGYCDRVMKIENKEIKINKQQGI